MQSIGAYATVHQCSFLVSSHPCTVHQSCRLQIATMTKPELSPFSHRWTIGKFSLLSSDHHFKIVDRFRGYPRIKTEIKFENIGSFANIGFYLYPKGGLASGKYIYFENKYVSDRVCNKTCLVCVNEYIFYSVFQFCVDKNMDCR